MHFYYFSGTHRNFFVVRGHIHSDVSHVILNNIEAHIRNICRASVQCFCALTVFLGMVNINTRRRDTLMCLISVEQFNGLNLHTDLLYHK